MLSVMQIVKNLGGFVQKNSPIILTGCAVAGVITTVILAVKATPMALDIIEEEMNKRWEDLNNANGNDEIPAEFTRWDIIRLTWKCYVPAAGMGTATIACIIGAHAVNQKRNTVLAAAYSLAQLSLDEFQSKVIETVGRNKECKMRDEIYADHVKANPPRANAIVETGFGKDLFYDNLGDRYFRSDIEKIRQAINELGRVIVFNGCLFTSVNEVYHALGLKETPLGAYMGWNADDDIPVAIFSSTVTDWDEPCMVLDFECWPKLFDKDRFDKKMKKYKATGPSIRQTRNYRYEKIFGGEN